MYYTEMAIGLVGQAKLSLITIFVECSLYGFFLLLAIIASSILLRRNSDHYKSKGRLKILAVVLIMFLLGTLHICVHFYRVMNAFFGSEDGRERSFEELDKMLVNIRSVGYILKTGTYYVQTYVGDAFVMYRVKVVWSGNRRVMAPLVVSFLASVGISIYVLREMAQAAPGSTIFESRLFDPVLCFFVLTLITNLGSTLLIAGRIHWLHSQVKNASQIVVSFPPFGASARVGGRAIFVAGVIIESGAIYSLALLIILILYSFKIHAVYVMIDAVTQLIGIAFAFIVIRIAFGVSTEAAPPLLFDSAMLDLL